MQKKLHTLHFLRKTNIFLSENEEKKFIKFQSKKS